VQVATEYIKQQDIPAILEVIPSYRAIMLTIDITKDKPQNIINQLQLDTLNLNNTEVNQPKRIINIPVCYGGDYGPDLEEVAAVHNLSTTQVIDLHTKEDYLIYLLGFMPGFPFLGGLSSQLHTPRRSEPRTQIPAGSVGIANNQTGLYPKSSPGGWQIIGQTPIEVFNIERQPMCLYQPGDYIHFYSITTEEFQHIVEQQSAGNYNYEGLVTLTDEY
ncbi:5-oxoprolinase subunit PxpB, partial [Staphylococcus arlettae]